MDIIKDMTPVMMMATQDINNYIRRKVNMGMVNEITNKLIGIKGRVAFEHKGYIIYIDNSRKKEVDSGDIQIFKDREQVYDYSIAYPCKECKSKGIYNNTKDKFINNIDLEKLHEIIMTTDL